jgi:haloalkane dehalogenase
LFVTPENAARVASNFKNIDTLDLGPVIFMLMEDNPHEIGEGIVKWFKAKVARPSATRRACSFSAPLE